MLKKLLGLILDAALYGSSHVLGQLINFFLLPLYTTYLTQSDYGALGRLTMFSALFAPVVNLGMTNAVFRRFNVQKDPQERRAVLSTGLASVLISSSILLLVCQLIAGLLTTLVLGEDGSVTAIRFTVVSSVVAALSALPIVAMRASRRVKTIASVNIAKLLVSIVATIWLVTVEQLGVMGVILGTLIAEGIFLFIQFGLAAPYFGFVARLAIWKKMINYGLPFVPHHLQAVGLAMFGEYMVGRLEGLGDAGIYYIAARFAVPVSFIVGAVQTAWGPYKFQIYADDADPAAFFRTAVTYYFGGLFYLWLGVSLWGPELVRLMTATHFHAAASLVMLTALVPVAQGLYFMLGTGIEMSDNTRPYMLVSFTGLVVVVAAAFTSIPRIGAAGAAVATASGWIVMAIVIYCFAQRRFQIAYDWPALGGFAAIAASFVGLGWWAQSLPLPLRLVIAVVLSILYPLLALALLLRSPSERERMHILLARLSQRFRGSRRKPASVPLPGSVPADPSLRGGSGIR